MAIVLLHGFTHTGASWGPVRAALPERYRAYAPDIRGHGGASSVRPVSLDAVIADVAGLDPGELTLVGYSMGGRIALHVALALAPRVAAVVMIGASPGIADPAQRRQRRAADECLAADIERSPIEQFAERWARTPVLSGQPSAVAAAAHADRLRSTPSGLAAALRGLGTGALPQLWDRLGEIRVPVALVIGERDRKFREIASEMARRLRDPHTIVVPGAGHAVHLEAPELLARIIVRGR